MSDMSSVFRDVMPSAVLEVEGWSSEMLVDFQWAIIQYHIPDYKNSS
jgi:hypothetical protein